MTKARDLANIISGGFTADDIPNLDAAKITSGSLGADRIPNLAASKITSGTLGSARIPTDITHDLVVGSSTAESNTAFMVDVSTQRVGIGSNQTPAQPHSNTSGGSTATMGIGLSIFDGTLGTTVGGCSSAADQLYIAKNNGVGMTLATGNNDSCHIFFSDKNDIAVGRLTYNHNGDDFSIFTNGTEAVRVQSDQDLHVDGDIIAFSSTVSDERLKGNVQVVGNALQKVSELKGVTFDWNKDGTQSAGLIAQDVEKVLPSAVKEKALPFHAEDDKEYKVVEYDQVTALLVEAIKQLKEENIQLRADIEALKDINS